MSNYLADFRRPLGPAAIEVMKEWAAAAQNRNVASLVGGRGPGGDPLAPNEPKYARRKGNKPPGINTGEMVQGFTEPAAVEVQSTPDGAYAAVAAGLGSEMKMNTFLKDRSYEGWTSERTPSGKRKSWKIRKGQPARDFIGVDEADVDATGERLLDEVAKAWGFAST